MAGRQWHLKLCSVALVALDTKGAFEATRTHRPLQQLLTLLVVRIIDRQGCTVVEIKSWRANDAKISRQMTSAKSPQENCSYCARRRGATRLGPSRWDNPGRPGNPQTGTT